jgi:hypothetical protein
MGSLFGKKKKEKENKPDLSKTEESILQAKMTRDNIKKYIKKVERTAKLKKDKAKEYLKKGDKDRAKIYLKMSKMYQQQIGTAEGQLKSIEEQVALIETTLNQSLKWSIILGNPELDGIRLIFILMIILPFSTFFISRHLFYKFKYEIDKINLYSFLICVLTIWIILISTSVYYFKNDFQKVFCPKKNKEKTKED